jgi:multidrug efflux pump subunit AcrA (membrane-fusion protein)
MDAGASYAQAQDAARQMQLQARLQRVGAGTAEAVRQASASKAQYGSSGAAAGERAAQSQTDLVETNRLIGLTKIAAPFDGIVVSLRTHEGENAGKGLTVARISDPEDLRVKFTVPLEQRGKLKVGQTIEVIMPGLTRKILASITAINDVQETRLAVMVVEADIDDSKLNPGEVSPTAQGHVRIEAPGAKS